MRQMNAPGSDSCGGMRICEYRELGVSFHSDKKIDTWVNVWNQNIRMRLTAPLFLSERKETPKYDDSIHTFHGFPNFRIPPSDFVHESLHGAIQFAAYAAIRSRTTNRMPYPDIWNHPRPFTCFSIFVG